MADILQTVLPVLLMLGVGALLRRTRLLTQAGVDAMKAVVVNVALPAVLLHAFATTRYTAMDVFIPLMMFAVCAAAWGIGRVAGRWLRMPSRFVPFLTTGFEAGMLGYALFNMLYGAEQTTRFARVDLGQVLFVFTLYKVLLTVDGESRMDGRKLVRDMLFSPIIAAIALGVLMGATGLYRAMIPSGLAGVFDACTDALSAPTSALILITIGYDLVLRDIPWRETLGVVALRLCILQLLRLMLSALLRALWPQSGLDDAISLMFLLPPPFVLPVFAGDGRERAWVAAVLTVSTVVAIVGFAALAAFR